MYDYKENIAYFLKYYNQSIFTISKEILKSIYLKRNTVSYNSKEYNNLLKFEDELLNESKTLTHNILYSSKSEDDIKIHIYSYLNRCIGIKTKIATI